MNEFFVVPVPASDVAEPTAESLMAALANLLQSATNPECTVRDMFERAVPHRGGSPGCGRRSRDARRRRRRALRST